ncbi:MAG: hydrolase [Rhodospirillales bacterium]
MLIGAETSCLLVVDIQERLLGAMADPQSVVRNTTVLLKAAAELGVPVLASEQYRRGLGATVPEVAALVAPDRVVEKMHFSCFGDEGFARRFREIAKPQVVVAGIEAHVCVLQTAEQAVDAGLRVFVVADATSSRTVANHSTALERLRAGGAEIVTTEMVAFEWLARAGTPAFKRISALIK